MTFLANMHVYLKVQLYNEAIIGLFPDLVEIIMKLSANIDNRGDHFYLIIVGRKHIAVVVFEGKQELFEIFLNRNMVN